MTGGSYTGVSWRQLLTVFSVAFAAHALSLANGFVWDDILLLATPSSLQQLENFPLFFKGGVTAGTSFGQTVPYYRPMFTLSLALEYALWGADPLGYHLTNLLLHGMAALLVTLLAMDLSGSRTGALAAGLVFAVHPVHAEAVAYVAARNELLCTVFALAALVLYCRYRKSGAWHHVVFALLFFFAALLSKEMAITLPFLIFLSELLIFRSVFGRSLCRTLPFAGVCILYLLLRYSVLSTSSLVSPPLDVRIATSFTLMGDYLRLLIFPWPLKVLHDQSIRWSFSEPAVISWAVLLTALIGLFSCSWRRHPLFALGGLWTVVSLLPASGLPGFIQPALIAERYLYLPSAGFSLLVGAAAAHIASLDIYCQRDRLFKAAGGILLLCFGLLAGYHGLAWHDEERLYKRMIADAPQHPLGYYSLGNLYGREQRFGEMASLYQVSLALNMRQQEQLVRAYRARGESDRAEQAYLVWKTAAEWRNTLSGIARPDQEGAGSAKEGLPEGR